MKESSKEAIMYRGIFTADWHLSNRLPYAKAVSGGDGVTDRLLEQMDVIRQIIKAAKDKRVDGFHILGDIFDKRSLDAIVLKAGAQLIAELLEVVSKVFIMVGNHDVYSMTSSRSVNEFFNFIGSGGAKYLNPGTTTSFPNHGIRFHTLPWCSLDVADERLKGMVEAKDRRKRKMLDVLLLHHAVKGAKSQGWVSKDGLNPEDLDRDWGLILSGHFHDHQTFGDKGYYVSAPMQHDFGDEGDGLRGFYFIMFDNSEYKMEFNRTEHARFYSMQYSTYLLSPGEHKNKWRSGDYVRFDVDATHAEWKLLKPEVDAVEKELVDSGLRVVPARFIPRTQHADRIELSESASTEEVLTKYLDVTSYEGLDRDRLLEIANYALKEAEND